MKQLHNASVSLCASARPLPVACNVRCLYHWSLAGATRHSNGSCVHTDKDGDNVFATFDDNTTYLAGGTGKYKGITGTVRYTEAPLHDTVGGRQAVIVNHKATWQIK